MNPTVNSAAAVLFAGAAVGFGPRRLLDQMGAEQPSFLTPARLAAAAVVTGLLAVALGRLSIVPTALGFPVAVSIFTAVALVDAVWLLIPDLYPLLIALVALAALISRPSVEPLLGAAVGGGLLFGVRELFLRVSGVEGMGLGDVKLGLGLGALLGPQPVVLVVGIGAVLGILWSVALARGRNPYRVPFGAALACAALGVMAASR